MPIFTIIGLAFSAIKTIMDIISFLEAHPEIGQKFSAQLAMAKASLNHVNTDLAEILEQRQKDVQSP